jgi:hypothetical protein
MIKCLSTTISLALMVAWSNNDQVALMIIQLYCDQVSEHNEHFARIGDSADGAQRITSRVHVTIGKVVK